MYTQTQARREPLNEEAEVINPKSYAAYLLDKLSEMENKT